LIHKKFQAYKCHGGGTAKGKSIKSGGKNVAERIILARAWKEILRRSGGSRLGRRGGKKKGRVVGWQNHRELLQVIMKEHFLRNRD